MPITSLGNLLDAEQFKRVTAIWATAVVREFLH